MFVLKDQTCPSVIAITKMIDNSKSKQTEDFIEFISGFVYRPPCNNVMI
jgi:hypothetical protein